LILNIWTGVPLFFPFPEDQALVFLRLPFRKFDYWTESLFLPVFFRLAFHPRVDFFCVVLSTGFDYLCSSTACAAVRFLRTVFFFFSITFLVDQLGDSIFGHWTAVLAVTFLLGLTVLPLLAATFRSSRAPSVLEQEFSGPSGSLFWAGCSLLAS